MGELAEFLWSNKEWLFSGIGVAVIVLLIALFKKRPDAPGKHSIANTATNINTNTTILNIEPQSDPRQRATAAATSELSALKARTRILFIDDDTTFAVVKILKQAGWVNTKIVKDIRSLDDPDVQGADIFFVDIQGVGKTLQFSDQGLGLARALKQKYPDKRLVIYSAEPKTWI